MSGEPFRCVVEVYAGDRLFSRDTVELWPEVHAAVLGAPFDATATRTIILDAQRALFAQAMPPGCDRIVVDGVEIARREPDAPPPPGVVSTTGQVDEDRAWLTGARPPGTPGG